MRFYSLISAKLFEPTHPITLGLFRIFFGVIMLIQLFRIEEYITEILPKSEYLITYDLFHWVKLLHIDQLEILFSILKGAAFLVTLGLFYRISIIILFLGWSYIFLVDAGHYNNHYYLYSLILLVMVFTKAYNWGSISQFISQKAPTPIPKWNVWIFQFQMVVVYFFGGIAKINIDWLRGYPMKYWLPEKSTDPFWSSILSSDITSYILSYGGLVFDLSIGFLLLFNKTRLWAIIPLIIFHLGNHFLWTIGTFPFFSILATILFFPPESVANWVNSKLRTNVYRAPTFKQITSICLLVYAIIQLTLPLRPFLYSGPAKWNGFGDSFSWRMMLTSRTNASKFKIKIPSENIEGFVDLDPYVNRKQFRRFLSEPKQAWRFAHYLGKTMKKNGADSVEVYAYLWKSVNGREFQLLMDTSLNLMSRPYKEFSVPDFINPMQDLPFNPSVYSISQEEYETKFKN